MKVKTALILCAGFGTRLNPITLEKPKPLIELNNITLLENTINLIKEIEYGSHLDVLNFVLCDYKGAFSFLNYI